MSRAERVTRRRAQAGMTLLEIAIAIVVLSLVTLLIEKVMASSRNAEAYLAAVSRATEQGRRITLKVANLVESSRALFQRDDTGEGYFAALDLARDPPSATARLPLFDDGSPLGPDALGDPRTGNVLLLVREGDPVGCVADPDTGLVRDLTVHRFVCAYPHVAPRVLVAGGPAALDLVVWRSVPFASYGDLMREADATRRANLVKDLRSRVGVDHAWDEGAPAEQAFYALAADGSVGATAEVGFRIAEDPMVSERGRLVVRDAQLARSSIGEAARRPVLSMEDLADWAPDGFELKVSGAAASRMVWIRLVVEAVAAGNQGVAVFGSTVIANTSEY